MKVTLRLAPCGRKAFRHGFWVNITPASLPICQLSWEHDSSPWKPDRNKVSQFWMKLPRLMGGRLVQAAEALSLDAGGGYRSFSHCTSCSVCPRRILHITGGDAAITAATDGSSCRHTDTLTGIVNDPLPTFQQGSSGFMITPCHTACGSELK